MNDTLLSEKEKASKAYASDFIKFIKRTPMSVALWRLRHINRFLKEGFKLNQLILHVEDNSPKLEGTHSTLYCKGKFTLSDTFIVSFIEEEDKPYAKQNNPQGIWYRVYESLDMPAMTIAQFVLEPMIDYLVREKAKEQL